MGVGGFFQVVSCLVCVLWWMEFLMVTMTSIVTAAVNSVR